MPIYEKAKHISKCLEMAILFEVSANKPGNVNFVVGFENTRVEHFLASAVAAEPTFEEAARRGIAVKDGKLPLSRVGMGQLIKNCVADIDAWQTGGNTLLGTVILFIPIAVAAGTTPLKGDVFELAKLREKVKELGNGVSKLDSEVNSKPSVKEYKKKFLAMIDDNLDTAGTLALVWEIVKNDDISDVDRKKLVLNFDKVLGLKLNKKTTVKIPENVKLLVKERDTARSEKNRTTWF